MSLLEAVKFEAVYAFKYSPRPFTKAARFDDQVPEDVQKERLDRLFKLQAKITEEVSERYTDQVVEVLVEGQDLETGIYKGRNEQNRMVYFKALDSLSEVSLIGKILPIRVTEVMRSTLKGEMMSGDVN